MKQPACTLQSDAAQSSGGAEGKSKRQGKAKGGALHGSVRVRPTAPARVVLMPKGAAHALLACHLLMLATRAAGNMCIACAPGKKKGRGGKARGTAGSGAIG